MANFDFKDKYDINDLRKIIEILRSENGCPWDKVQTHESIRTDLIEETYEVCEGIDKNSPEMLREELGDLLLQIVFHAQIERENGTFDFDDVCMISARSWFIVTLMFSARSRWTAARKSSRTGTR